MSWFFFIIVTVYFILFHFILFYFKQRTALSSFIQNYLFARYNNGNVKSVSSNLNTRTSEHKDTKMTLFCTNVFNFLCRRQAIQTKKVRQEIDTKVTSANDESINLQDSVESLPDMMDSNISTEVTQCTQQNKGTDDLNVANSDDDYNFVIDNTDFIDVDRIEERMPEGRSIVDISYMWNEIHRTFDNHAQGIECQFKDWKLVNSRRSGLLTQLFFKCQMCNYEPTFGQNPQNQKH